MSLWITTPIAAVEQTWGFLAQGEPSGKKAICQELICIQSVSSTPGVAETDNSIGVVARSQEHGGCGVDALGARSSCFHAAARQLGGKTGK